MYLLPLIFPIDCVLVFRHLTFSILMKTVVGLGNPGREYSRSRHNVGFAVVGELSRRHGAEKPKSKFDAEVVEVFLGEQKFVLAAPQTYMNLSGRSVRKLVDFYRLSLDDLLVVCDDLNLQTGRLRLRRSGSAGGQKGLKNIIEQLGTGDFGRLRIGIGQPPGRMDATDYVLGRFRADEVETIDQAVAQAATAVESWCQGGIDAAMNRFNATDSE